MSCLMACFTLVMQHTSSTLVSIYCFCGEKQNELQDKIFVKLDMYAHMPNRPHTRLSVLALLRFRDPVNRSFDPKKVTSDDQPKYQLINA